MPHVYVIVSRILRQLHKELYLDEKQCLGFLLLLAASERAEKNPLEDIVEPYKLIV